MGRWISRVLPRLSISGTAAQRSAPPTALPTGQARKAARSRAPRDCFPHFCRFSISVSLSRVLPRLLRLRLRPPTHQSPLPNHRPVRPRRRSAGYVVCTELLSLLCPAAAGWPSLLRRISPCLCGSVVRSPSPQLRAIPFSVRPRSAFDVQRSALDLRLLRHSPISNLKSPISNHQSPLPNHRPVLHRSTFRVQRSTFNVRRSRCARFIRAHRADYAPPPPASSSRADKFA
jgi:hypothetical protein